MEKTDDKLLNDFMLNSAEIDVLVLFSKNDFDYVKISLSLLKAIQTEYQNIKSFMEEKGESKGFSLIKMDGLNDLNPTKKKYFINQLIERKKIILLSDLNKSEEIVSFLNNQTNLRFYCPTIDSYFSKNKNNKIIIAATGNAKIVKGYPLFYSCNTSKSTTCYYSYFEFPLQYPSFEEAFIAGIEFGKLLNSRFDCKNFTFSSVENIEIINARSYNQLESKI